MVTAVLLTFTFTEYQIQEQVLRLCVDFLLGNPVPQGTFLRTQSASQDVTVSKPCVHLHRAEL